MRSFFVSFWFVAVVVVERRVRSRRRMTMKSLLLSSVRSLLKGGREE